MSVKKVRLNEINLISRKADFIIKLLFAIGIIATCIYPLLIVLGTSFTDNTTVITQGYNVLPKVFSTSAYNFVLQKSDKLFNSYKNSLYICLVGTLIGVMMMSTFAYAISRKDFKYRKGFSMFAYITFIFNGGLVPFYYVYSSLLGLTNTYAVLIIPYLVDVWYVLILRTFFQEAIPLELIESAKLDGAGELRIFVKIALPLAIPGMATITLFTVLKYWNDFQLPLYFIESTDKFNLQYLLYRIMANMQFMAQDTRSVKLADGPLPIESARMAMCVLGAGPLLIAYPFFQKYFIKGLTMGAVKG